MFDVAVARDLEPSGCWRQGLQPNLEMLTPTNCNIASRQFPELHHKGSDIKLLLVWLVRS